MSYHCYFISRPAPSPQSLTPPPLTLPFIYFALLIFDDYEADYEEDMGLGFIFQ